MSSFDQIFDRFGNLIRSWAQSDSQETNNPFANKEQNKRYSGDNDLDEAMEELDAFLDDDKEKQERLRKAQEARRQQEEQTRNRNYGSANFAHSGPDPKLLSAYKTMGLTYGTPFDNVKATYKKLLKEHHPDKHSGSPEELKKATEMSTRINNAYRIIETWHDTGKIETN